MTEDYILAPQEKYGRKNKPSGKVASKLCTKCSNALPLTEFYKNPQWGGQSFHDAWCRNCVKGHCKDRETLREYCWYNNRLWRDDMYEKSIKQAEYTLSSNADYLKATPEKKQKMLDEQACSHFLGKMNLATVYSYCDNISEENIYREFKPNSLAGTPDG